MGERKLLTIDELCQLYNVTKSWVYDRTRTGELPKVTFAGKPLKPMRFDIEVIDNLFQSTVLPIKGGASSLKTEGNAKDSSHRKVNDLWL